MPATQGPLITIDNAYLPDTIRTRMTAAGITNFRLGVLNGPRRSPFRRRAARRPTPPAVTGNVEIMDAAWKWDAHAQRGETLANINMLTTYRSGITRLRWTLCAIRQRARSVCRIALTQPGHPCKPLNVLGYDVTTKTDPGQQFVHVPSLQHTDITQNVFGASITGEPFSVWAGPLSVALSAEHRKDETHITVDPTSAAVDHIFGNFNPLDGQTDVTEGAVEVVVPVTTAEFALGKLDINAGARATRYSYFGDVKTWKVGGTYNPIDDLTIRGDVVRATSARRTTSKRSRRTRSRSSRRSIPSPTHSRRSA